MKLHTSQIPSCLNLPGEVHTAATGPWLAPVLGHFVVLVGPWPGSSTKLCCCTSVATVVEVVESIFVLCFKLYLAPVQESPNEPILGLKYAGAGDLRT